MEQNIVYSSLFPSLLLHLLPRGPHLLAGEVPHGAGEPAGVAPEGGHVQFLG